MTAAAAVDRRFTRPTLIGVAIAVAMFWAMGFLIADGKYVPLLDTVLMPVDFIKSPPPQVIDPVPPKPPKPAVQPPRPKIDQTVAPPDKVEPPKIVMPNVIDGPRFDGLDVTPGSGSADGMLIPMVRVLPQYPRQASRDGIAGYVVFEVVVNPDGTVKSARPIKSQPRGVFEANAMQAIMKWKFRPRVVDGKAVEARGTQQIDFALPTEAKD